ncbi:hypothetical protein [Yersinia phage fHe-Yen9-04]|uniref:Uncharacterized protein n=2 Tax=Eneladusvirus Yen904 TaxID=2560849 RepID=A0A2C9CX30_9CAUD|nr:hypothetical protein FDJ41_gp076 [Yersinia phage fHe-Yen9-04]SOK58353.1 hypothetical protein [Yersinia phage fHe-Yen9-04]SOK58890.1 hypothetical protein [Yersinia phage fHe-Yen9-03]VUE36122.1 hypothetical protein [Yersinia phage fHe-Yen9-04]
MAIFIVLYLVGFISTIMYYIMYKIKCVENGSVSFGDIIFCFILSSFGWMLVPLIVCAEIIENNYGSRINKFFSTPLFKAKGDL